MQQPLLILSAGEDLNDDALQIELERRGACVRRFILNKAGYGFRYNFVDDTWQVWGPSFELSNHSLSRIWLRSLAAINLHHSDSSISRAAKERSEAFNQFVKCLPSRLFLNKPSSISAASQKTTQLVAARESGLLVPETHLVYDLVQSFSSANRKVVKLVGDGVRSLGSNEIEVFPTTRIEDLRFLDEYFPGLVQTEIER